jgi:hypothetical protein
MELLEVGIRLNSETADGDREGQPDDDIFYDMAHGICDNLLDSPLANLQTPRGGMDDTDVCTASILEELDRKARELDKRQLVAVVALQQARAEQAQVACKELEAAEKESLAKSLLAELEAKAESVDSFFAKQAMREKVKMAAAERVNQAESTALATTRVNVCVDSLVEITMQVKCFRLNSDVLRKRCTEGAAHDQEEEERTLATRMQALSSTDGSSEGL